MSNPLTEIVADVLNSRQSHPGTPGTQAVYTLQQLATDIRTSLEFDPGRAGRERIRAFVSRALRDEQFVAEHLKDRADPKRTRDILYEDPKLGFCICAHFYQAKAYGQPHDHGPSWAIYGQATGVTEMTDWRVVEKGTGDNPTLVEPARKYDLNPGDAHFYDIGDIHSPRREGAVKLIRIEGANLDLIKRTNIKPKPNA